MRSRSFRSTALLAVCAVAVGALSVRADAEKAKIQQPVTTEVALEVRIVSLPEDLAQCLEIEATQGAQPTILRDQDTIRLLGTAMSDPCGAITQLPRVTVMDRQTVPIRITKDKTFDCRMSVCPYDCCMSVCPVVSEDRRFVEVALQIEQTEYQKYSKTLNSLQLATRVNIPDGSTCVLGGLKKVTVQETLRVFVLVTPRIVVTEDEAIEPPAKAEWSWRPSSREQVVDHDLLTEDILTEMKKCWASNNGSEEAEVPEALEPTAQQPSTPLADLLKAYEKACVEGDVHAAKKYAKAALLLDPTCFSQKR